MLKNKTNMTEAIKTQGKLSISNSTKAQLFIYELVHYAKIYDELGIQI